MPEFSKGRCQVFLVRGQAIRKGLLFKGLINKMKHDSMLPPLSPPADAGRAKSNESWLRRVTCTTSLTRVLSVPVLALCRPLTSSPIQVMRANLTRLLMASPVVNRTKPNNRTSSGGTKQQKQGD